MPDNPGEIGFPSNSRRQKPQLPPQRPDEDLSDNGSSRPKLQKVITGEVIKKKENILDRLSKTFFNDDAGNVVQFVLHDVLVPSIKNTMVEMIKSGAEMLFFGETKGNRTYRDGNQSRVSYGAYFKSELDRNRRADPREREANARVVNRSRYDFSDIVLGNRGDFEIVLSALLELIDRFHMASVADFYDALGISNDYVDNHWGWTDLSMATIAPVRYGWRINLPDPIELD
jgi:hypothetical protein